MDKRGTRICVVKMMEVMSTCESYQLCTGALLYSIDGCRRVSGSLRTRSE